MIVGGIGDLMITVSVLIALFIVYLVGWTDVSSTQQQDVLIAQQQEQWGAPPDRVAPELREDVPVVSPGVEGEIWAVMHVPAFTRSSVPIAEGTDLKTVLNTIGMGHYPATQDLGERGNFAMAGHRTTYGKPLVDIAELEDGDPIVVETPEFFFVYRATDHQIVSPEESRVLAPVPGDASWSKEPSERILTLTACHPKYSLSKRYIVHAEFDYYTERSAGIPNDLAGTGLVTNDETSGESK